MNTKSLLITIFVAFLFISVTDFLIHAGWLSSTYGATKELWRPEAEMNSGAMMGWMFLGKFLVAATFTTIFAACVAEKRCLSCTLKFAACLAIFAGGGQLMMYSVQPYPGLLIAKWIGAGLAQLLLLGFIVHKLYKLPAK